MRASPRRASRSTRSPPTRRPGRQCRHNLNYWRFGDYLGIGAGAHGKATVGGAVIRTEKPRSPRAYLAGGGRLGAIRRAVPAAELPFEFMLNALRLAEGFRLADFERDDGPPGRDRDCRSSATLPSAASWRPEDGRYRATDLGFRFLNDLLAGFLPEETAAGRPGSCTQRLPASCQIGTFVTLLVRCLNCHAVTH